ncbi:hypothetical protein HMPREF9056_00663 [Actinomyces sp. oral taxon 170 str. F0386]|nr:hypothetical protein HMPREF9056_00663 [Actinomyces sp. oral taxon 170 str. F0386]
MDQGRASQGHRKVPTPLSAWGGAARVPAHSTAPAVTTRRRTCEPGSSTECVCSEVVLATLHDQVEDEVEGAGRGRD